MYRLANPGQHEDEMKAGAAAFRKGVRICDGPHEANHGAVAWESGWLGAMQEAVLGMSKKPKPAPTKPKK